jgi:hypothetical protein
VGWRRSERCPGENGDGAIERVVGERPPVAIAGMERRRLAGPVHQHVRKKRRCHPRGVAGRIRQAGQASGGAGDLADPLAVGVQVRGRGCGVQGVQVRFGVWRVEEQGAEHGLADAVDLSWRGVVAQTYPCPHAKPGAAECGVG